MGYLADFQRGLATNLLNPKSLIFCSVLLPQFIHPELSGIAGQFAILALILVLTGLVFDFTYAVLGRALSRQLPAATPDTTESRTTSLAVC